MDGRKIFDAINTCDDVFIKEVVLDMENRRKKQDRFKRLFFNKNQHLSGIRIAAAIVLFIVILGVGVKTTAHVSMLFRDWMENVFQKCDVTEIVPDSKTVDMGDSKISLKNDVQMTGQNETFLYETSYDGIEEKVEKVFSIEGKKQKELLKKKFEGHYKHLEISFEYSTIDNEIFAYNIHGAVEKVFPVMQKNTIYAVLETSAKEYTQNSSQNGKRLVAINLQTGEIQSELASKTVIDFVMAPNGRYALVQYNLIQSDGSVKRKWTSFDLQTKEEKNLEKLENKNLEIDTLNFIDTTRIAVGGKVNNEGDYETLYYTDISTGKTKEYTECGNVTPEWNCDYSVKKKTALFQNIVTGKEFLIKDIETNPSYSISIYKDYFLIWNEEDLPSYLCNIKEKTAVKLNPPEELRYTLQVYFSQKENALLFTNEKEVYLVNLEK
ncbi:MAG: hypothetical protein ACLVII_12045 [Anaerobutyricum soehngenii]